jgi:hypothetical protein
VASLESEGIMNPPYYKHLYWCKRCNEETTFYVPTLWPKQTITDPMFKDLGCPYYRLIMCCKCKTKFLRLRARKCKTCEVRSVECLTFEKGKSHPYKGSPGFIYG